MVASIEITMCCSASTTASSDLTKILNQRAVVGMCGAVLHRAEQVEMTKVEIFGAILRGGLEL